MADKKYKINFEMTDGSVQSVEFTAPQGEKGDKGDKGEPGAQGIQGERGLAMYLLNESMAGSVDTFPFTSFKIPTGYVPQVGDLVIYKGGQLASIREINADSQTATVGAFNEITLVGPAGSKGDKGDTGAQGPQGEQGIQGEPGAKGDKGDTGANGTSATHSWNGTTLTITSASGTSSANLKGEKGDKGDTGSKGDTGAIGPQGPQGEKGATGPQGPKGDTGATGPKGDTGAAGATPVKGVDYWTSADQESIVQQVIAALGTPVFGTVDAQNNIILSGNLADGTYVIKYEDAEGNLTEIGTLKSASGPKYTNILPLSINSDGTPFVGANGEQGYKTNTRLGSSGTESTSNATGMEVSGFIPVAAGDTLYFKGVEIIKQGANSDKCYCTVYNSSFSKIAERRMDGSSEASAFTFDGNNCIKSVKFINSGGFTANIDGAAYFRFSATEINSESIVTKNEPIE